MPRDDVEQEGQQQLSEYEQRRIDNIKRNNARLRALGLISSVEERRSNAIARGIIPKATVSKENGNHSGDDSDGTNSEDEEWCDDDGGGGGGGTTTKRKRKSAPKEQREGQRKSRRLKGEKAEYTLDTEESLFSKDPAVREKERGERVEECRQVRLRAANAIAACGGAEAAKKNPTATYEHCLMRVKTMTEKGLVNRVKAIERAAGKHCVVKMAIFKSCLQDEGRWELAELANDALERLKALKPIPEE
eukprot:jgi/Psemu1/316313/fgenesh1_kg.3150_\